MAGGEIGEHPEYRTFLTVDIEGYGRGHRTDRERAKLRGALTTWSTDLFGQAGAERSQWELRDTGDGWLASVDPKVPVDVLLTTAITGLRHLLVGYNTDKPEHAQLRLRLAVHSGWAIDLVVGEDVNHVCRLLDSSILRACLAATRQPLAVIASVSFYDGIIRHAYPGIDPDVWHLVPVATKEGDREGWLHVPGDPEAPQRALAAEHSDGDGPASSGRQPVAAARTHTKRAGTPPARNAARRVREERKLVTVLVVGIVTQPGPRWPSDPEDVRDNLHNLTQAIVERIVRHGGVVDQASSIGRVLALFGADRSREDDPERAVHAALDVVDCTPDADADSGAAVRAAVATGVALIRSEDGHSQVIGNVIDAAVAGEKAAGNGMVLVSATTYQATSRVLFYVPVEPAGGLELASGMRLWRAVQPPARAGAQVRRRAAPPLVERDRELAFLEDVLGRFLRDRLPQSVTLVSDPGLGKSRMVDELSRMVDNTPKLVSWRVGHARAYGQGPLGALAEIVKAELGILDGDDATTTRRKLDEGVTDLFGDNAGTITGSLDVLLGTVDTKQLSSQRETLFDDWARYLAAVAEQRPQVLVCEDLQWADPVLLEFAGGLTGRVGPVPLLLVVTARPELLESAEAWGGGQANAVTLTLAPLSREGTGILLDELLTDASDQNPRLGKERLSERTRGALLDAAGGNPLYVEEYVHMLAGQEAVSAERPLTMPTSVQQVIAARIDTLPPADKRLLQDAAVVGETGWVGQLATVSGTSRNEAHARLRRLERRGLLQRSRNSSIAGEEEYAFRHVLIRDVAYEQLLRPDRADKHQRAADWIESRNLHSGEWEDMLAHHHRRARERTNAAEHPTSPLPRRIPRARYRAPRPE